MTALRIVSRNDDLTTHSLTPLRYSHPAGSIMNINRFDYTNERRDKYESAVIDTVRMLGFMSLKNSDHSISGPNAAACKRALKDAVETRKAADRLIERGVVTLMGTWSNGIQVGPGEGFVRVTASAVAAPVKAAKTRKARVVKIAPVVEIAPVMHGPAYVPPVGTPPGYIGPEIAAVSPAFLLVTALKATRAAQSLTALPTAIHAPVIGQTLHITCTHADGRTTDRVVTVLALRPDGFRATDHTYGKTRNFYSEHITITGRPEHEDIAAG